MSYLREVREDVQSLKAEVEGMLAARNGSSNVNTIKIEGAGSIWNGLAVGIALGAVIVGGAWIISSQQRFEMIAQQSEAYSKAVYMLAPRFAKEIDEELDRQKEPRNDQPDPDHHAAQEAATGR